MGLNFFLENHNWKISGIVFLIFSGMRWGRVGERNNNVLIMNYS